MSRLIIACASMVAVGAASPAQAAPVLVVDPRCLVSEMRHCFITNKYESGRFTNDAVAALCRADAEGRCTTTVDVATPTEVQALIAEGARQQREQWAAWLKTLEDTGVVQPVAPPPPAKR